MQQNKWFTLAIVSSALFLISIDMTVLYTALPRLTHDLNASNSQKLWIVNAYPLVMAGLLPGLGALGDRIGYRRMLLWGLAVFGIASLCAAYAPSAHTLIAARAFLAVGAALMMPATLSLLRMSFTSDKERALAIGIWGSVYSGGAAIGPLIGGLLLNYYWWGAVFLVNVPIVLLALVLTPLIIPHHNGNPQRHWDFANSLLIMVALIGLMYGLKEAVKPDANFVIALYAAVIGFIFTALFVWRQGKSASPIIDFLLFRNRYFSAGALTALMSTIALMGVELAFTQRLQLVLGFSPLKAGAFMLPISISSFIAGPLVGFKLHKIGIGRALWLGFFVATIGLANFIVFLDRSFVLQTLSLSLFGFGAGAAMATASTAIMINAPEDKSGMAASIESVAYEVGGALGVAIMGSILTLVYAMSLVVPEGISDVVMARDSLDQALLLAESMKGDVANQLVTQAKTAYDTAFVTVLMISTLMLLSMAAMIAFMTRERKAPGFLRSSQAE